MTSVSPIILLDAIRNERETRECEQSLAAFVRYAWPILEPSTEMKWGWALDAICLHLQAVSDGEIYRLLMNVPPGSCKSLLTNVFWPAWEWGPLNLPHMRFLSTAHKQDLAIRDNLKCRRLIKSDWYQSRWPVNILSDQDSKSKFENDKTGFREAMAFTSMTGSRGDRVTLDDPLSVDDANSDAALAACESTFREALPTRLNDDAKSAIVVIMQRLHEKDPSGIILKEMLGYEHLMLPMEYERARSCRTSIGFSDPRKEEGELMFPERFGPKTVASYKKTLGDYAYAGQMQQRPSPAGGGILKTDRFQLWPVKWKLPVFEYIVQSYDGAYDDDATSKNDPSACTVWGIFEERGIRGAILLDAWDDHLGYPDFRKKVLSDWHCLYGKSAERSGKKADAILVENKSSGISILQDLRRAKIPAIPYNPGRMSKIARAHAVAAVHEMDYIYILESNKEPGKFVTWARKFVDQVGKFPNDEHDDYCIAKGSLISMGDGTLKPIETVKEGDQVLTPEGNRKVLAAFMSGVKPVWKVKAGDKTIFATGNHPFALREGIYGIITDMSNSSEVICLSSPSFLLQKWSTLISTVRSIIVTQLIRTRPIEPILNAGEETCTVTCGNTTTGLSPKDIRSIISMETLATTESRTLNVCLPENTLVFMGKKIQRTKVQNNCNTLQTLDSKLQSGTSLKRVESGIAMSLIKWWLKVETMVETIRVSLALSSVVGVVARLKRTALRLYSVLTNVNWKNQVTVEKVSLSPPQHTSDVYNLTVEGSHCYYANGFLTHNCDTYTQVLTFLRDGGQLELPETDQDEVEEDYVAKRKAKRNPYAA